MAQRQSAASNSSLGYKFMSQAQSQIPGQQQAQGGQAAAFSLLRPFTRSPKLLNLLNTCLLFLTLLDLFQKTYTLTQPFHLLISSPHLSCCNNVSAWPCPHRQAKDRTVNPSILFPKHFLLFIAIIPHITKLHFKFTLIPPPLSLCFYRSEKAILDFLSSQGYSQSFQALQAESNNSDFTPNPNDRHHNLLAKKWTSVIRLQKK
ncbi:Nuclear distribution protein PAC1, partial [Smittium culicis]